MMLAQSVGILVLLTALGAGVRPAQAQASVERSTVKAKRAALEKPDRLRNQLANLTVENVPVAVALTQLSKHSGVSVAFQPQPDAAEQVRDLFL